MSRQYNYPIPEQGLFYTPPSPCQVPNPYPKLGGIDWTTIVPKPKQKTFFEFAQTFWRNMINTRNRQFITDGKTGGYPTLQMIYWKYLESLKQAGIPNDNFTYQTMIDFVNGMGDYWIQLIEQMVPATTIWNTGVRLENSIFHRQKFVWRRQEGCKLIPGDKGGTQSTPPIRNPKGGVLVQTPPAGISVPTIQFKPSDSEEGPIGFKGMPPLCRPCALITNVFEYDCAVESIECPIYPWESDPQVTTITGVLGKVLNTYLINNGYELNDCVLNSLTSEWYIQLKINNIVVIETPFFNGTTYSFAPLNAPTESQYYTALISSLNSLKTMGYDYYITENNTVVVFNQLCQTNENGFVFTIDIGINFQIFCS
jgi:hypothetical protein